MGLWIYCIGTVCFGYAFSWYMLGEFKKASTVIGKITFASVSVCFFFESTALVYLLFLKYYGLA